MPTLIWLLAVTEGALFFAAIYGAVLLRFAEPIAVVEQRIGPLWHRALVFALLLVVAVFAFGLYSRRQRARRIGIFVRLAAAVAGGTALTTVVFFVLPQLWIGRGVVAFGSVLALLASVAARTIFHFLMDERLFKRNVLVYGTGEQALSMTRLRRRSDRRGFTLIGFVRSPGEDTVVPAEQCIDAASGLLALCLEYDIDELIVAMDERRGRLPIRDLLECRVAGIEVSELATFLERETGRVRVDVLNPSWIIFGEGFRRDWARRISSRTLDLITSIFAVLMTWPLMLAVALAIKLEDGFRAPVIYRQERVGLGGSVFQLLKFRSMRIDAESDGAARWAQVGDPRVTRVGAIIRKLRLDELPQILNVLRGDMSFVGPRPERPQFVRQLEAAIPYYVQRHCVRPGITGWAQLCYPYGASERDAIEKLQFDLYYIKNNSLLFDLSILLQTIEVVLLGKGAR
jgi:sugar transferase (PEP-CTERM system associated)